jgi:hypothetical protein
MVPATTATSKMRFVSLKISYVYVHVATVVM